MIAICRGFRWMSIAAVAASSMACQPQAGSNAEGGAHLTGGTAVEEGRYLAITGGCNDCHTNGYLQTEGNVPETEWVLGSPLGWRGPWMNANQLAEVDARALYAYIRSLGVAGERMPTALPPKQEPTTPYLSLFPVVPEGY